MPAWEGASLRSISPGEPWCTSPRECPRWCARLSGKRLGYPQEQHAAAQRRAELHRSMPAVGGMVWIQRRQRSQRGKPGDQRFCGDSFRAQRLRRLAGAAPNGFVTASPALWERSRAASPAWSPSRRHPVLSRPMSALVIGFIAGDVLLRRWSQW